MFTDTHEWKESALTREVHISIPEQNRRLYLADQMMHHYALNTEDAPSHELREDMKLWAYGYMEPEEHVAYLEMKYKQGGA